MTLTTTVVNKRYSKYDVYIGRPSKWGNPFSHLPNTLAQYKVADREEAILRYREWIFNQPELLSALPELRGKCLGCWCKPAACHGDILKELCYTVTDMPKNILSPTAEDSAAESPGVFASLPLVSTLNKKLFTESKALLEECETIDLIVAINAERKAEILLRLEAIQLESKLPGLRFGDLAFRRSEEAGRQTLKRDKLLENGVSPDVIAASYETGKPIVKRVFRKVKI